MAASWVVTFRPQEAPVSVSSSVIGVAKDVRIATDAVGAFSVELIEGRYWVLINNDVYPRHLGDELEIDVPSGAGSFTIGNLVVVAGASVSNYTTAGVGSPEGVIQGSPGFWYRDTATGDIWQKATGTGNTGWVLVIGS